MYSPQFQGPSDAEHRANNRTRFTTMLASVSMLTLGLSLGSAGVSGTTSASATSAVVQPSTQASAAPTALGSASTQTPRSQDEDSEAAGSDS